MVVGASSRRMGSDDDGEEGIFFVQTGRQAGAGRRRSPPKMMVNGEPKGRVYNFSKERKPLVHGEAGGVHGEDDLEAGLELGLAGVEREVQPVEAGVCPGEAELVAGEAVDGKLLVLSVVALQCFEAVAGQPVGAGAVLEELGAVGVVEVADEFPEPDDDGVLGAAAAVVAGVLGMFRPVVDVDFLGPADQQVELALVEQREEFRREHGVKALGQVPDGAAVRVHEMVPPQSLGVVELVRVVDAHVAAVPHEFPHHGARRHDAAVFVRLDGAGLHRVVARHRRQVDGRVVAEEGQVLVVLFVLEEQAVAEEAAGRGVVVDGDGKVQV
mmetsp:Transcript_5506/g.17360  ORF Transcript_5506/g.17360 Transcript_5506/m.17360 type:complete len:327 (+) Transcript_5506:186-1166(+)